jgi:hypothetical protein
MVQHLDVEQLPGSDQLDGEGDIGRRGGGIARGVVVDGDEGGGLLAHRVAEDLTLTP